ncbi:DUF5700 domain-containing putative Zn-dependent protease, partial [Acidobacteriota bacterium]
EKTLTVNVDFSGVEMFLELTALLEKDKEPTREQWNALFATPGYAVLIRREFQNQDFFIDRFKLAFMPSLQKELETQLQEESGFRAQFLPHYVRARKERRIIEDAVKELKNLSFVQTAVEEARKYLPDFELESYPPVSFVIFGPDARGYVPVVLDIFYTLERKEFLKTFVAHEFHHYYRSFFYDFGQDQQILWVINQIQGEGIADQINVGEWFHDKTLYAEFSQNGRNKAYLEWYAKSPEIIREMDRLFSAMYDFPEKKGTLGAELQDIIPLSGHPTGFYMANLIIEQLGKNVLIEDVKNPFAFFRHYQDAAVKKGGDTPSLSEKSIQFILSLEKRYIR